MTAITELKKHGVLPENVENEIDKIEDEYIMLTKEQ